MRHSVVSNCLCSIMYRAVVLHILRRTYPPTCIYRSKSCVLLYWQRYCTTLQQRASAKLCSVVQRMELRNFRRRRHLYSAGRPSRWASSHILVFVIFLHAQFCSLAFYFFLFSYTYYYFCNFFYFFSYFYFFIFPLYFVLSLHFLILIIK